MKEIKKNFMLSFHNINLDYGERTILDRVSFNILQNDRIALVGPNGAGKTTIFRLIMRSQDPDSGSITISKSVNQIGYMPQTADELSTSQDNFSVYNFMLSGRGLDVIEMQKRDLENHLAINPNNGTYLTQWANMLEKYEQLDGYAAESNIKKILSGLELDTNDLDIKVGSLSGGMKTRLFLARVLYSSSNLLLLDEPSNNLDQKGNKWLANFLSHYRGTSIIISHNHEFIDTFASKIFYLNPFSHKIENYNGNYTEFLEQTMKNRIQEEKKWKSFEKEKEKLTELINRLRAGSRAKQAQSRIKSLQKLEENAPKKTQRQKSINVDFPIRNIGGDPVIIVDQIAKSYDKIPVIMPISFSVRRQERIVILGPNGAGKTTLLRILASDIKPDSGNVKLDQKSTISYYAQEHEGLDQNKDLVEELQVTAPEYSQQKIRNILGHFLFSGEMVFNKVANLSPGEKARLALAKVVTSGANLLILDEPTNHLDLTSKNQLLSALQGYEGAMIIISHDETFLENLHINRTLLLPEQSWFYIKAYDQGKKK